MVSAVFTRASARIAIAHRMEMSHPSRAEPAAQRLDYPTLTALLGLNGAGAPRPAHRDAPTRPSADASAEARLVLVILGRSGWRGAARSLNNRFAPK